MKRHYTFFIFSFILFPVSLFSQQNCTFQTKTFAFAKHHSVNISEINNDWNVKILNVENPVEDNKTYAEYIEKCKSAIEKRYPRKDNSANFLKSTNILTVDTPFVINGFEGNLFEANIPNDNSLAVSNDAKLMSAMNCNLYFYDLLQDSLMKKISLGAFSDTLNLFPDQYDPKLLYDSQADRFIAVYLAGFLDSTSSIIVGFSQTEDPTGFWNLYYLPGNPLADTSWSDFPAIAITNDELFVTVNLLKNDEEWQAAFKQSVVWQIDKASGYSGSLMQTKLWSDIKFDGKPIRNLNPIQGGSHSVGPDIYLLSDRNFSTQNDSLFLLHVSNNILDTSATMTINALISDKSYGMPPNAKQPMSQLLQTNDARVLGGFIENNNIQFVGNTIDTTSGFATFYHGIVSNVSSNPSAKLTLMSDTLEFGYPNISYTGKSTSDNTAMITVNYSNSKTYPGFCAFYYNGAGEYSQKIILQKGNTFVNLMSGADRWGDYSGSQRVYNDPGKVWVAGSFGKYVHQGLYTYRLHGTWLAELQKPADEIIIPETFDLLAYPNPVSDQILVDLSIPYDTELEVALYDINGRLVKLLLKGPANAGKTLFSFSTLPLRNGIYFLSIQDSKSIFLTRKIVKGE